MTRILLRWKDRLYRFLQYEFADQADGSLYVIFDRTAKTPQYWDLSSGDQLPKERNPSAFRISYHASGTIRYHGAVAGTLYADPIYAVEQRVCLGAISVPGIGAFQLFEKKISESDSVIDFGDSEPGRMNLAVMVLPHGDEIGCIAKIEFGDWFSVVILRIENPHVPAPSVEHVIKSRPNAGPYSEQPISEEHAFLAFRQRLAGVAGQMSVFWDPGKKAFRVVTAVPMRVPPALEVEFEDPSLSAKHIVERRWGRCQAWFQVVARGGTLPSPARIRTVRLDAEL